MSVTINDFWPTRENCTDCFITAAETASDPIFLAVHQSMPLSRRLLNSSVGEAEKKSEKDLLDAFLTENLPSGTLILPIVGSSGVGKSHMIRWLEANMRVREDGVRRHIVRIPRSSSLRRVLGMILDTEDANEEVKTLLSESKYRELHKTLTSASLPPTVQEATHQLRGKLLIALDNAYQKACKRLAPGQPPLSDEELRKTKARKGHCAPSKLPALLQDPVIYNHFMAYDGNDVANYGVLARIAARCISGQRDVEDGSSFFAPEDLIVDESFVRADMAALTRNCLTGLERRNGAGRKDAVAFLNELIDDAISQLLGFGGFSLTDLFVEIRKCLLEDKIELVLLIEDFASLAGIQGSLLDAIISEGVRGKKELCTMRTALAVTEGYLSNRETVSTRADYEWKIEDKPFTSEAEAVRVYTSFVSSYLNAARWGKTYLADKFESREVGRDDWLPDFFESKKDDLSEEDIATLQAFGRDEKGAMLFPFNQGAIRQLIKRWFREGDSYKFNPRELIKRVLNGTLWAYHGLYEEGVFPPEAYQSFSFRTLETSVSGELRSRVSSDMYERMAAFVYHWGDNPRSVGQAAAISEKVYQAFGLSKLDWSAPPEIRDEGDTPEPPEKDITLKPGLVKVDKWKEILRKWKEEGKISQEHGKLIRNMIIDSAWEHVDWNTLLLARPEIGKVVRNKVWIPKASTGNPDEKNAIIVALSDEDWGVPGKVDKFFMAIEALCSFSIYKSWNYDNGEIDSINYRNYFEGVAKQVELYYSTRYQKLPREGLVPLAQALLIGARVQNLPGATSKVHSENVLAIYSDGGDLAEQELDGRWWKLYNESLKSREEMLKLLYSQTTARQGRGDTPLAVDAALLLRAIDGIRETWSLGDDTLSLFKDQSAIMTSYVRLLKGGVCNAIEDRLQELNQWVEVMTQWFPDGYDYKNVTDVFLESIRASKRASVFSCEGVSSDHLKRKISDLEGVNVSSTIIDVRRAQDAEGVGPKLGAVAKVEQSTITRSGNAFKLYELFLDETGKAVSEGLKKAPLNANQAAEENIRRIEEIENLWSVSEENKS